MDSPHAYPNIPVQLYSLPRFRAEQDQHRQDLQSAKQHGKGQNQLGDRTVSHVACVRADRLKGRADIGNTRQRGGKVGKEPVLDHVSAGIGNDRNQFPVDGIKGQKEGRADQDEEV